VKAFDLGDLLEKTDSLAGTPLFVVRTGPAPARLPEDVNDGKRRANTAEVLFHVGGDTLYDRDNFFRFDERPEDNRRVIVDLGARMVRCPFEIGERNRGIGRERINGIQGPHELALLFDNRFSSGMYRFHVIWRATNDEGEGFEVFCNDSSPDCSRALELELSLPLFGRIEQDPRFSGTHSFSSIRAVRKQAAISGW